MQAGLLAVLLLLLGVQGYTYVQTNAGYTFQMLLRELDAKHIKYHAMRFPSEPGVDLLVVTPLNKRISPFEAHSLGAWFGGC